MRTAPPLRSGAAATNCSREVYQNLWMYEIHLSRDISQFRLACQGPLLQDHCPHPVHGREDSYHRRDPILRRCGQVRGAESRMKGSRAGTSSLPVGQRGQVSREARGASMACVNNAQGWLICCTLPRCVAIPRLSTTKGLWTLSGSLRAQRQTSMRAEAFNIGP